jgi:hypothetical protein
MQLPVDVTWGRVTIVSIVFVAIGFILKRAVDWWRDRRVRQKERVRDWHKDMLQAFSEIRSVGTRLKTNRRGDIEVDLLEELIEPTKKLDAHANPPPPSVFTMVDRNVRQRVEQAAGVAYHFAHLPKPEENEDSIAGVLRHHYKILQELDADTDVEVGDVIEVIGEISPPDELDVSEGEAKQILEEFEKEANKRMENTENMTVDEFMELPWEEVDRMISAESRQELIRSSVEQYYKKALLEKPQEAKRAINESEKQIFG